jgi:zinc transporter 1/2/3
MGVSLLLRLSLHPPLTRARFAKFFGSGVIIATAFIHLLAPAWDELTSDCLVQVHPVMGEYDWAPAIALMAVYFIFFAEVVAYRVGRAKLEKLGMAGYGECASERSVACRGLEVGVRDMNLN